MPPDKVIVPETVLVRELQAEAVLLDLATETYFGLDDVGTRFWQALVQAGTIEGACEILLPEYEVAPDRLEADMREFAKRLTEAGLIHVTAV